MSWIPHRKARGVCVLVSSGCWNTSKTYRFAGGDLEHLGGETNGTFHAKLLVLGAVDEIIRNCVETFFQNN